MNFDRIAIGTAQFGLEYGVSNKSGQVNKAAASEILRVALERGLAVVPLARAERLVAGSAKGLSPELMVAALVSRKRCR